MGAKASKSGDPKQSLVKNVDYVATNLILTQNFEDMVNLANKEECDKLTALTSNVINKFLTSREVNYLAQRTKYGDVIDEMAKDKVIYLSSDDLKKLDIRNTVKKKRVCIGIAKFYVKIAHVFGAILTTVNPTIIYKTDDGDKVKVNLQHKSDIPENAEKIETREYNLCSKRYTALLNKYNYENIEQDTNIIVHPDICHINEDSNTKKNVRIRPRGRYTRIRKIIL